MPSNEYMLPPSNLRPTYKTRSFPGGIHVPSLTFFEDTVEQNIDWNLQSKHLEYLISSGLHGVVIAGTNGEAATLTKEEKARLVRTTRKVAQSLSQPDYPITVGCLGGCTRKVVQETREAAGWGANFALVLVPSYFHFAMDKRAVVGFFNEVADNSPIPIVIYNFPNVVAGLDVDSDMLEQLGRHPNIVGVKLTCGGIAKVTRAAAMFDPSRFGVFAGQSDWLVPALTAGGAGCITGVANLYPRTCLEIFRSYHAGQYQEAQELQEELARAEWCFADGGISGTKWMVCHQRGYPESSSHCRRPYPRLEDTGKKLKLVSKVQLWPPYEQKLVVRAKS